MCIKHKPFPDLLQSNQENGEHQKYSLSVIVVQEKS